MSISYGHDEYLHPGVSAALRKAFTGTARFLGNYFARQAAGIDGLFNKSTSIYDLEDGGFAYFYMKHRKTNENCTVLEALEIYKQQVFGLSPKPATDSVEKISPVTIVETAPKTDLAAVVSSPRIEERPPDHYVGHMYIP